MRVYLNNKPKQYIPSTILKNKIIKQKKFFEMQQINIAFVMPANEKIKIQETSPFTNHLI